MKINMLSENYINFERAFYPLYDTKPLYSLVRDIADSMTRNDKHYFRLPASCSKDGKDHYFYFKIGFCQVDHLDVYEFDRWE